MEKETKNEELPKPMTPKERAEKEANKFIHHGEGSLSQAAVAGNLERIIKEAIEEDRRGNKIVSTVFGSIFAAAGALLIDKIGSVKAAMEIEREQCAKIADQIRERELANYTGGNYPSHTIAEEIRDQIKARGEKS